MAARVQVRMKELPVGNLTRTELVVSANNAKLRLDQFLAKRLPEFSRSRLQQLIRIRGVVRREGDEVVIRSVANIASEAPLRVLETINLFGRNVFEYRYLAVL